LSAPLIRKDYSVKTILIVDDDPAIQQLISAYINDFTDYKAIVAEDGEAALDIIIENSPDLIIIDMLMPRIGGIALYSDFRKLEQSKNTPVIFMSGALTDEVFQTFLLQWN